MRERYGAPLAAGELALLVDPRGQRYLVWLQSGRVFHHARYGSLRHEALIGQAPGVRVRTTSGAEFACLRPTLEDFLLGKLERRTQIIYPKDAAQLLLRADVFPGAHVLEAGIGSAAAALVLLRYLGPEGRLVSYERREEFAKRAAETIARVRALYGDSGARHELVIADVYEGIAERGLDVVLLDVPEPWRAAPHAAEALRPGGRLACWVPTALQVHGLVRALQDDPRWAKIETTETLVRPWDVAEQSVRPAHRMVAHTGFMICARRVALAERGAEGKD